MKLMLIRHGLTEALKKKLYYGATDVPVSEEGFEMLRKLRKTHVYPKAECYYTSGMLRAEQTFELLFGDIPHTAVPGLSEMNFGDFEMKSYEELKHDEAYQRWISGDNMTNFCPNGESYFSFAQRVEKAIRPIIEAGRDALVVCHGGVISSIMTVLFGGADNPYIYVPEAGYGYQIDFNEGLAPSYKELPEPQSPDPLVF